MQKLKDAKKDPRMGIERKFRGSSATLSRHLASKERPKNGD